MTTLTRDDIQAIAQAVGAAVGAAIAPVIRESMDVARAETNSLRREVFDAMGKRVSRDECTRTHAALPPVLLLGVVGGFGVVQTAAVSIAVWMITRS